MIILKHYHLLILIAFIVQIKMEPTSVNEEDDYDYNDSYENDDQKDNSSIDSLNNNQNTKQQLEPDINSNDENQNLNEKKSQDTNQQEKNIDYMDKEQQNDSKYDKSDDYKDDYREQQENVKQENDKQENDKQENDKQESDKINDRYDISKYQNLKYEHNRNYEIIPNNYELINDDEDNENENSKSSDHSVYYSNDDIISKSKELNDFKSDSKPQIKFNVNVKPKLKKSHVKLIKEIKYPKSIVSNRPKYYYPGRNFVHQRSSSKKDKKLSKIKIKSNKFTNDELATYIPLELYKRQIRSRFVSNNEYSNENNQLNKQLSSQEELELPHILNGELYCDCGFYLKLKNKKINKLNSKLKKVSNEQKQMKRKLFEMAIKENQLQLICRSQSKANLKYINKNNGKSDYLALSNATSLSNPIDLI